MTRGAPGELAGRRAERWWETTRFLSQSARCPSVWCRSWPGRQTPAGGPDRLTAEVILSPAGGSSVHTAWGGGRGGEGLCGFAQPTLSAQEEASTKMPRTENQGRKGKCRATWPRGGGAGRERLRRHPDGALWTGIRGLSAEPDPAGCARNPCPSPPAPHFSNPPEPQRGMERLRVYYGNYSYNIPTVVHRVPKHSN